MSAHVIKVPDLGEGIAEVELVEWHVAVGDRVAEDQVLADVMTDKATVEIPSPVAGTVLALGGEVGQMLSVGTELIRIERAGGAGAAAPKGGKAQAAAAPPAAAAEKPASKAEDKAPVQAAAATRAEGTKKPNATPAADRAKPVATPAATAAAASPASSAAAATRVAAGKSARSPVRTLPRARVIASPAVRARAWEFGVDLAQVPPGGTAGRIMQADLDAYVARHGAAAATLPSSAPATPASFTPPTTEVRIIGLRRRIAEKMQASKRRIPHYSYVEEVDVTELERLRERLNARYGAQRPRLTLLPFLARAIVIAAREFPAVNATLDDEAGVLTQHGPVHLGLATQTDAGLMVPVLRDAHTLDPWAIAAGIARLADAARTGRATRDELSGSTITITSLGRLGGIATTPVINHPEVAIVGVNRIVTRPMYGDGGAVMPRQMMNLSSSFDHRVVDGFVAASFVQAVKGLLEGPAELFVA